MFYSGSRRDIVHTLRGPPLPDASVMPYMPMLAKKKKCAITGLVCLIGCDWRIECLFGADSLDGCVCVFPGAYFVGHLCAVNLLSGVWCLEWMFWHLLPARDWRSRLDKKLFFNE